MADEESNLLQRDYVVESIKSEIDLATPSRRRRIFEAIALAAIGSIPWVGGVIAAASVAADKIKTGEAAAEKESLFREWLQQHQDKLQSLHSTLSGIVSRLEASVMRSISELQASNISHWFVKRLGNGTKPTPRRSASFWCN